MKKATTSRGPVQIFNKFQYRNWPGWRPGIPVPEVSLCSKAY